MRILLIAFSIIVTAEAFAAKCVLTAQIKEGSSCSQLTTRVDVAEVEACEEFAKSTKLNQFFGTMSEDQELLSTSFTFKDRTDSEKFEKSLPFADNTDC